MQRRARIVVLVLLVLTTTCSPGELTKSEFIREADAICDEFDDRLAEMAPPKSIEGIEAFAEQTQAVISAALTELRALQPPEEDEEKIASMLDNLDDAGELLPELARAAAERDLEEIQELNGRLSSEINDFNAAATDYGLKTCAAASPSGG